MNENMQKAAELIRSYDGRQLRIMEVCGTHTHEIFKLGIRSMLPEGLRLISGPGCPVCVTPVGFIDEAMMLAEDRGCTVCTFGDLVRVPGTAGSLATARASGATVQMVYSPIDAQEYARDHPSEEVVFLSVGFETTTPASCIAVRNASDLGLTNFSLLTANKTMDNAYRALKGSADAFLYPGHVSTMTGTAIYRDLLKEGVSGVVAGFTGAELLSALAVIIRMSERDEPFFVNCYPRVVTDEGSPSARRIVSEMMEPVDSEWRGLGVIERSGLRLRDEYSDFDARIKYAIPPIEGRANPACRCGDVLQGKISPSQCPLFAHACTPEHPVGACMVSSEGACAAAARFEGGRDGQ